MVFLVCSHSWTPIRKGEKKLLSLGTHSEGVSWSYPQLHTNKKRSSFRWSMNTPSLPQKRITSFCIPRNVQFVQIYVPKAHLHNMYQGSTYPLFFLVEVNSLMDCRRRNDILDSKILSSFNTSSLLRPVEESLVEVFSVLLSSLLIYRKRKAKSSYHLSS